MEGGEHLSSEENLIGIKECLDVIKDKEVGTILATCIDEKIVLLRSDPTQIELIHK